MPRSAILLDGAVGTNLWAMANVRKIPRVPVWQYNITHPELVSLLAARFIRSGSEIILANTFCANGPMVAKYPGFHPGDVVSAGVRLARGAAGGKARVALSVGPLERVPFDRPERLAAAAAYDAQLGAGADAGADIIFLQTFWEPSLLVLAAERAAAFRLPVFCSMTFGSGGTTYSGCRPADMMAAIAPFHPAAAGLNCSCGPAASLSVLSAFRRCTDLPLIFKPNVPAEHTPGEFAEALVPSLELVSYAGGCCGTTPDDIFELAKQMGKLPLPTDSN